MFFFWVFSRECQYRVIPLNSGTEPRGTKRLHQTPVPSRSPSPHTLNQTCNTIAVPPGPISLESVASRAKRRYQEASEGLSPIPHSTCHLNINTEGFRPDNLLNRGEWDRVTLSTWLFFEKKLIVWYILFNRCRMLFGPSLSATNRSPKRLSASYDSAKWFTITFGSVNHGVQTYIFLLILYWIK